MSPETSDMLVQILMLTLALLAGWLAGATERRADEAVLKHVDWDEHVQQALYVARRWPRP